MGCQTSSAVPRTGGEMADALAWHRDQDVLDLYDVIQEIGEGSMGTVAIVRRKVTFNQSMRKRGASQSLEPGSPLSDESRGSEGENAARTRTFAMKTIHVGRVEREDLDALKNEIEILRHLDHPNIINMLEVLYHKRRIHMVMELCSGGHLSKTACAKYTEARVCYVFKQILNGLAYLHANRISHNDLKAENIVFVDSTPSSEVRLIDFGLSQRYTAGTYLRKVCGTYYTMAPEVFFSESGYSLGADMWSAGAILFVMLSRGQFPFLQASEDLADEALVERWRKAKYLFDPDAWDGVSPPAKELVSRLLKRLPGTRATAQEALNYLETEWEPLFEKDEAGVIREDLLRPEGEQARESVDASEQPAAFVFSPGSGGVRVTQGVDAAVLRSMQDFASYSELKKHMLMVVAFQTDRGKLKGIAHDFVQADTERDGTISLREFRAALKDHNIAEAELQRIFEAVDLNKKGKIRYREFLAATVEAIEMSEEEALQDAFDRLDSDNSGFISLENLKSIMGPEFSDEAITSMLREAGLQSSKGIDYEGFLDIVRKQRRDNTISDLDIRGVMQSAEAEQQDLANRI